MCRINFDLFLENRVDNNVLQNITKYCSHCYRELLLDEQIYLNQQTYSYLCSDCACELSEALEEDEPIIELEREESLF